MEPSFSNSRALDCFFETLKRLGRQIHLRKNHVIFSHGDPSTSLFYVQEGHAKLTSTSARGREAFMALVHQGDVFGESCLGSLMPTRFHTAVALTDMSLVAVTRTAILGEMHDNGGLATAFVVYLVDRYGKVHEEIAHNLWGSSEQRLARVLVSLCQYGAPDKSHPFFTPSQQDLADMIGVTRQRVNMLLQRFRRMGYIRGSRNLTLDESITKIAPNN